MKDLIAIAYEELKKNGNEELATKKAKEELFHELKQMDKEEFCKCCSSIRVNQDTLQYEIEIKISILDKE